MSDDATLLRRYVQEGSEAAFTELVHRHIGLVYGAALRQLGGAAHRAEDVTQTVFSDLAINASALSRRTELAGWLYTSTHYAAAKLKRSEQRRSAREQEAQLMQEMSAESSGDPEWERLRPVLDDAILQLHERDREVLLFRFFQGCRFAEIGQRLGLSEDAARMRTERALDKLRGVLAKRGIGSSSAALAVALSPQTLVASPPGLASVVVGAAMQSAVGATAKGIFMNTPVLVCAAVAVITTGATFYQRSQALRAEVTAAAAMRERDALRSEVHALQQRAAKFESEFAATRANIGTVASQAAMTKPQPVANDLPAGSRAVEEKTELERARRDVEERRALRKSRSVVDVRTLDSVYRSYYRQMGFSPQQTERFVALVFENAERHEALDKLAGEQGMKVNDPKMLPLYAQADADFYARIGAAFGSATSQALQHFVETVPLRPWVEQIATSLFNTDSPLNVQQSDQLVEILSRNLRNAKGQLDVTALNADAIIGEARTVLADAQLPPLKTLIARLAAEAARKRAETVTSAPAPEVRD